MQKELHVNRESLITTKDALGNLKFLRTLPGREEIEIATHKENLIDVWSRMLWPLDNLKDILGQEENPGPVYFLLSDMLETLTLKNDTLCEMIEEESGGIEVHECNDIVSGVPKGTFLGVSLGSVRKTGVEIGAQTAVLIAERDEWKQKFEAAEEARLLVSRRLSYYVSEESAGRLHIDPIPKGATMMKIKEPGKKSGGKVKRAA